MVSPKGLMGSNDTFLQLCICIKTCFLAIAVLEMQLNTTCLKWSVPLKRKHSDKFLEDHKQAHKESKENKQPHG